MITYYCDWDDDSYDGDDGFGEEEEEEETYGDQLIVVKIFLRDFFGKLKANILPKK
ncbi:MAG: hypothetical protein HYZ37_12530 [Candidatus Solibacter usitatus]|nr:hypothetical protein [Candidatus Solibacter usitatus]